MAIPELLNLLYHQFPSYQFEFGVVQAIALSYKNCSPSDRILKKRAIALSFNNCRENDRTLKKGAIAFFLNYL
ncbi:hypothetical protein [Planktothrix agardhii]|uniref:hypothetical protein n=1 Tax=Planktothrix agardhii TaxID=1160 RepID=UPI0020B38F36|nr:hypothetical protein [Planktothrix agardhii]MCP9293750.1 hypothetical protein [Planktothrix agardhii LY1]